MDPNVLGQKVQVLEARINRIEVMLQNLAPTAPDTSGGQEQTSTSNAKSQDPPKATTESAFTLPLKNPAPGEETGRENSLDAVIHHAYKSLSDKVSTPSSTTPVNWLGGIAAICFVIATGFIIKLSIDSGWLTPPRQIGIAVLFGFTLVGAGLKLMESDREYSSLLPAAGIVVFYISIFGAHNFYGLIDFKMALATSVGVSTLCVLLYTKIRHDLYLAAAVIGAYLAPILLDLNATDVFTFYYFIVASMAFSYISAWLNTRSLSLLGAYLCVPVTGYIGFIAQEPQMAAITIGAHLVIYTLGTVVHTIKSKQVLNQQDADRLLPPLLVFYAFEYYFIHKISPEYAPWISVGFAGVVYGLYYIAKKQFGDRMLNSRNTIMGFVSVVLFHSVYLNILPDRIKPWLFVVILLSLAAWSFRGKSAGPVSIFVKLAVLFVLVIEYINMMFHMFGEDYVGWRVVASVSTVSLLVFYNFSKKNFHPSLLLGVGHALGIMALYRWSEPHGSLAVTGSWLFYGAAIVSMGVKTKDVVMAKSAIFVLVFAAGKALLYDAASAPSLVRIACLLLTGTVLYAAGFALRKIDTWTS